MISLANLQKSFVDHGIKNITDLMGNIIGHRHDVTVAQGSPFEKRIETIGYKKLVTLDFLETPVTRYFKISYHNDLPGRTIARSGERRGNTPTADPGRAFIREGVHHD